MKKIILLLFVILNVSTTPILAQEETTQQPTVQEEVENETTLSEELDVNENNSNLGFFSILFATLTPALLIVVAYLLIKMNKE